MKQLTCAAVFLLLLNIKVGVATSDVYMASSPQIWSPNYPSNYPDNTDRSVAVSTEIKNRVFRLSFSHFDLEYSVNCTHDYLIVYDGYTDSSPQLSRLCGNTLPSDIYSTQTSVLLKFHSDANITHSGFSLTASSIFKEDHTKIPMILAIVWVTCGLIPVVLCVLCGIKYKNRRKKHKDISDTDNSDPVIYTVSERISAHAPNGQSNSALYVAEGTLPSYNDVIKCSVKYFVADVESPLTDKPPSYSSLEYILGDTV